MQSIRLNATSLQHTCYQLAIDGQTSAGNVRSKKCPLGSTQKICPGRRGKSRGYSPDLSSRQVEPELTALAQLAVDPDMAALRLNKFL